MSHYITLREMPPKDPTSDEEKTLTILGKNLEKYGIHFNKFLMLNTHQREKFVNAFDLDCQSSLKFLEYIMDAKNGKK